MLAEAEKLDVLDDDHFVVSDAKRRAVENVIDIQVIAAGEKFESLFKTLRRFAQALAIGVFADDLDHLADVACDAARVDFLAVIPVIQQDFFRWLGHERFPSVFRAYSKLLLPVSWMRTRSSLAWGKS